MNLKALKIINEGVTATQFAIQYWGKNHSINTARSKGNSSSAVKGKKGWLCAGSYLRKMIKKGLVTTYGDNLFVLTSKGVALFDELDNEGESK